MFVQVMQMEELGIEIPQSTESRGTIGRSRGAAMASSQHQMSVTVVSDFVHWNEEAISRSTLFSSQVYLVSLFGLRRSIILL